MIADNTHTPITTNNPDSLLLKLMKTFLKKLIIDPTITTGCILVGSSANIMSIINDNINAKMTNANIVNESRAFTFFVNTSLIK